MSAILLNYNGYLLNVCMNSKKISFASLLSCNKISSKYAIVIHGCLNTTLSELIIAILSWDEYGL